MEKERRVRCNHCMNVVYEEYLIKADDTESGERCPICKKSDALMDVTEASTVVIAWRITKEEGEDATKELLGVFENGKQATAATASLPFWISFEEVEIGKTIP